MITLPGLIDPHVHFRTPGQSQKEDFLTGTQAALAGGYTTVIDMPNNVEPITTEQRLNEKIEIAKTQIVCDVGFHFGSLGENFEEFPKVQKKVLGLKIYLNQTTGGFTVDENMFRNICETWPKGKPILVHAEGNMVKPAIEIAHNSEQKLHIVHVSSQIELTEVINAKQKGYQVTCGVTPHHLFLTSDDAAKLGPFGAVKPSLKTKTDVDFLWNHLADIDLVESDHAPHTKEEKQSATIPSGVPGLETTLALLLTAANQGKLTIAHIQRLCSSNPAKIFEIALDPETKVEVDETEEWTLENEKLFTKARWSPFNGWNLKGKVKRVFLRGEKVYENGMVLAKPGSGKLLVEN